MSTPNLKQRLTTFLFPSLLLIFVALYVTSLASGAAPEMALLRSGGAAVVMAVLGRVALGIVNDEETLAINELSLLEQTMAEQTMAASLVGGHVTADGARAMPIGTPTGVPSGAPIVTDVPSDASAALDAPTGFIPTPLGARAGASTVEALVRSGQLDGQE